MDLTKQAIEQIEQTAVAAALPRKIELPGDGRKAFVALDQRVDEILVPPPLRMHQMGDLASLMRFAIDCGPEASIWYCLEHVICLCDDADRRDRAAFEPSFSLRFKILEKLDGERPAMQQHELVRLLRLDLGLDPALIAPFRRLDWQSGQTTSGEIQHTRDRLGREVQAAVTSSGEIPETMQIAIPVYSDPGLDQVYTTRLAVDLDHQAARIRLIPLPGETELLAHQAVVELRKQIGDALADAGDQAPRKLYWGTP